MIRQFPGAAGLIALGALVGWSWGLVKPGDDMERAAGWKNAGWGAVIGLSVWPFGPVIWDTLA